MFKELVDKKQSLFEIRFSLEEIKLLHIYQKLDVLKFNNSVVTNKKLNSILSLLEDLRNKENVNNL